MTVINEQKYEDAPAFLEIKNLYLNFSVYQGTVQVLDGVNIKMKKGEILGIVGETGCGKTVTSRSVVKLLESNAVIEEGEITFEGGDNLVNATEGELEKIRGRRISVIFQEPMTSLNPTMRIGDQVGEGILKHFKGDMIKKGLEIIEETKPMLAGLYTNLLKRELDAPNSLVLKITSKIPIINRYNKYAKKAAFQESIEILESVGMPAPERISYGYPHELSGGMRQRVLIAISLAAKPELIIADEPTTAVDVTTQAKILKLLLELRENKGTSLLVITHNLGVIAEICDRVCVMYAGQIAEVGKVSDIFKHPFHPYTQGLMNSIHDIGDKSELEAIAGYVPILLHPPSGCRFHPRCPQVMDTCIQKPNLTEHEAGHHVHCWLYQRVEE